ncbi:hypothetical protein PTTG_30146 [Puccinia triticina 1-1 BBBD Race 1]|uniref:Uncharacterized protein n=1 Tax=Puccinia triticina (isolate 1-1 / race 1 (BBBD)) TaxID=630390 RepID=A0A180G2C6_PUCT1|nr:hypothetical protein PTTG_30146 [Puccinia triticina 1-1 BBBD Race 1]
MVEIIPQDQDLAFDGTNVEEFLKSYQTAARADGASEYDMAQQICYFLRTEELMDVVKTLDGFKDCDWKRLKASMLAHWGPADTAWLTVQHLEDLMRYWSVKEGISPAEDYPYFCLSFEPICRYLLRDEDIDEGEIQQLGYQAFCLAYRLSLLRSSSSSEVIDRPAITNRTTHLEPPSTRFADGLPKTSLELNTGDWDTESDSSDESTEEPSRAFSQPPQPLNASCGSRQPFGPPAFVASKPLARAEHEERCTGVESEVFDPLNEGPSHADAAREFPEDSESFESLQALRAVEDLTPTVCYKLPDLLCASLPPGLSPVKEPLGAIQDSEKDLPDDPKPFKRSTEESSHPEAIQLESRSLPEPSDRLPVKPKTSLLDPMLWPANLARKIEIQSDPPQSQHESQGSLNVLPVPSPVPHGEADPGLAWSRTGVGSNQIPTSEDRLRNEGKLLPLQFERGQGVCGKISGCIGPIVEFRIGSTGVKISAATFSSSANCFHPNGFKIFVLVEAERLKVSSLLSMRLRVDAHLLVKTLPSATLVSHTRSPFCLVSFVALRPTITDHQRRTARFAGRRIKNGPEATEDCRMPLISSPGWTQGPDVQPYSIQAVASSQISVEDIDSRDFIFLVASRGEVDPSFAQRRTGVGPHSILSSYVTPTKHTAPLPTNLGDGNKLPPSSLPLSETFQSDPSRRRHENQNTCDMLSASYPPALGPFKDPTRTVSCAEWEEMKADPELVKLVADKPSQVEIASADHILSNPLASPLEVYLTRWITQNRLDHLDGALQTTPDVVAPGSSDSLLILAAPAKKWFQSTEIKEANLFPDTIKALVKALDHQTFHLFVSRVSLDSKAQSFLNPALSLTQRSNLQDDSNTIGNGRLNHANHDLSWERIGDPRINGIKTFQDSGAGFLFQNHVLVQSRLRNENKLRSASCLRNENKLRSASRLRNENKLRSASRLRNENKLRSASRLRNENKLRSASRLRNENKLRSDSRLRNENKLPSDSRLRDENKLVSSLKTLCDEVKLGLSAETLRNEAKLPSLRDEDKLMILRNEVKLPLPKIGTRAQEEEFSMPRRKEELEVFIYILKTQDR